MPPKSYKDPRFYIPAGAMVTVAVAVFGFCLSESSQAWDKADAASEEAESVASDLKAHVYGESKQDEALIRQLDRMEASIIRIQDQLTAIGYTHPNPDFPMIPAPPLLGIHSTGYNTDTGCLYVRYLVDGTREPGSIYRYAGVLPGEYLDLVDAPEPLDWIWDNLRMRGTVSGHTRDYELVGIGLGGVPRKATYRGGSEWYVPRTVLSENGEWITSGLPEEKIEDNQ